MGHPQSTQVQDLCDAWHRGALTDDGAREGLARLLSEGYYPGIAKANVGMAVWKHTQRWDSRRRAAFIALCKEVEPEVGDLVASWVASMPPSGETSGEPGP